MKRLLFLLALIPFVAWGQKALIYGGKVVTESGKVVTYSAYCAEYQAVYDDYTTKPDAATAVIYNHMVEQLVAAGLWSTQWDIVRGYGMTTNAAGEALINWINPALYGATAYNAPTFTALQGFTFDGATQYNSQNWIPSSDGVKYTQNSASWVIYIRTNIASVGVTVGHGVYSSATLKDLFLNPRRSNNLAYVRINSKDTETGSNTNGSGLYVLTRTSSSTQKLYRNAVLIVDGSATTSSGAPTITPFTGAYNDDGTPLGFRADEVFFEAFGALMTQEQVTTLNAIIEEAADALGVGVQSPTMIVFILIILIYAGNRKKFDEAPDYYINSTFKRAA